ncbi:MAG: four-carbon acid sugar kinase family protein, partial [Clostridiales bacterium]|nr:four-carbon acid sugar kinase family protein [Clostridiales bacterium]
MVHMKGGRDSDRDSDRDRDRDVDRDQDQNQNRVFVIADDFTGALDTGVQFARLGAPVLVTLGAGGDFDRAKREGFSVLVVDAESRHIAPEAAAERVGRLTREAVRRGFTHFYKKTDSALRGNIGAELAAMLGACGASALAFAPAFPKSGRVTRGGIQYIDGLPLGESVFANDPFEPVRHSEVARIIAEQTCLPAVSLPIRVCKADGGIDTEDTNGAENANGAKDTNDAKDTNGAKEGRADTVKEGGCADGADGGGDAENMNGADGASILIYDAETDDDLLRLGRRLKARGRLRALAGCAG